MVLFELCTAEAACFLILTHLNVPKEGIRRLFLGRFSSGMAVAWRTTPATVTGGAP